MIHLPPFKGAAGKINRFPVLANYFHYKFLLCSHFYINKKKLEISFSRFVILIDG